MANYPDIIRTIDRIFLKRRGYVFKIPYKKNIVFLVSGGLDSSVTLDKIIQDWQVKVYPLFIKRRARAEKYEEQAFNFFFDFYSRRYPKNFKECYKIKIDIPPKELKPHFSAIMLKTLGYPMRDAALVNIGVQYAVSLNKRYRANAKTIFMAMTPDEAFPHCGMAALRTQNLLTCIDTADWKWQITSPLTEPTLGKPLFKKDLIRWAVENNIPLKETRTCVSKDRIPDGTCPECLWRKKAFKETGIIDPIKYRIK